MKWNKNIKAQIENLCKKLNETYKNENIQFEFQYYDGLCEIVLDYSYIHFTVASVRWFCDEKEIFHILCVNKFICENQVTGEVAVLNIKDEEKTRYPWEINWKKSCEDINFKSSDLKKMSNREIRKVIDSFELHIKDLLIAYKFDEISKRKESLNGDFE